MRHPAFQTGMVQVEPELRDEMQRYWEEHAAWEKTRQGPPPEVPSVSVRVDHEGKPTEAAGLRDAVAKKGGGGIARDRVPRRTGEAGRHDDADARYSRSGWSWWEEQRGERNGGAYGVMAAEQGLP
ncbi:hypothetical protein WMF37_36935 [Sorangium sp. So ce291]|uniref:hypothetical protein n=1 Tax=Sorangium sp. So ce291 TaxID=3133294 RepID=UPI003F642F54